MPLRLAMLKTMMVLVLVLSAGCGKHITRPEVVETPTPRSIERALERHLATGRLEPAFWESHPDYAEPWEAYMRSLATAPGLHVVLTPRNQDPQKRGYGGDVVPTMPGTPVDRIHPKDIK